MFLASVALPHRYRCAGEPPAPPRDMLQTRTPLPRVARCKRAKWGTLIFALAPTLALALSLLSACSFFGFGAREYQPNPDTNHTHADFAVWIDGQKLDFSDAKYMSGLSSDETTHDEEDEYHHQYLHLHDGNGHVIHTHKPGLALGEFFTSLGFSMTEQCLTLDTGVMVCPEGTKRWWIFVSSEEWPWDPANSFRDMDKILLTYNGEDDASKQRITEQLKGMTDDACLYSRTCPWRGDSPTENCIADPEVPCVLPPLL